MPSRLGDEEVSHCLVEVGEPALWGDFFGYLKARKVKPENKVGWEVGRQE